MARRRSGTGAAALGLLEVRRILEAGAAELCAQRRSDADLALLNTHMAEMDKAITAADASTFARAETAFHETIVRSCGNVFLPAICASLDRMLLQLHTRAATIDQIRLRTQNHHRRILAGIASASPDTARDAMHAHFDQTAEDLLRHVIDGCWTSEQ